MGKSLYGKKSSYHLPQAFYHYILMQSRQTCRQEVCGLIGGIGKTAMVLYPIANIAARPNCRFEMAPALLIGTMRSMREQQLALQAIYHSHPYGSPKPSRLDIQQMNYPGVINLIASPQTMTLHAFFIKGKHCTEISLILDKRKCGRICKTTTSAVFPRMPSGYQHGR